MQIISKIGHNPLALSLSFLRAFGGWAQEEWKRISRKEGEGAVEKKRVWAGRAGF